MSKKITDKYKKLDDISHVLKRPGMYIGSIKPHKTKKYLYNESEGKMLVEDITYNPGFIKIFDEIITNSVDESKRPGTKLNTIKVNIIDNKIKIWDNGGIPVLKSPEHKEWIPEMIFSNLKAGSNFDDTESRIVAGTNGVGSTLTNIYSKEFIISTCDGKNLFSQTFSNNMRDRTLPIIKKSNANHSEITYLPDYEKFELEELDETHYKLIQKRVIDIAGCNPTLKVFFNNEEIKIKSFEDYIKYYRDDYFFESNKDKTWSIAIAPSNDGFQQISFVNSTDTYDGGTHIDYILNQILSQLREFFQKKHKVDVKPSELKNHMMLFINSTVVNPSFSSQTKEKCITEIKDFGFTYEISDKLIKSILKSEIVNSILDWVQQKKAADESKLARDLNKNLAKIKVEKLIDAKGKDRWKCSIGIFEGDSAISAFRKYRVPETMGAFALKGKFTNVSELTNQKLVQNNEVVNLMGAIGLKLGQDPDIKHLRYGRILFYVDADVDGNSIAGLLLNFLNKYWPGLFDRKMVYKVETPIIVAVSKKDKKKKVIFYTQSEYDKWYSKENPNNWEIKYKKGLAALVDDEYDEIINNPKLTLIKKDELSDKYLDIWFGKNSELRKLEMIN
jgi:DNA topoisomerase-2